MTATQNIHYQTGRGMLADPVDPFHHDGPGFLSQEKSSYQKNIGIPGKTDIRDKSKGNDDGNRYMDGQEPLK
jgi:hypothetical protein